MKATTYLNPNYEICIHKMAFNHFYRSFVLVSAAVKLMIFLIGKCEGGFMDLGGSYELEFKQFSPCENEASPYFNYTTKTVINDDGTKFLEGFMVISKELGDTQNFVIDAYRWGQNAGYQSIYHMDKKNACSYIKQNFPGMFKKFTDLIGSEDNCPVKEGRYELSGLRLDGWTLENLQRLPYGTFMVKLVVKDGDTTDGCMLVKVDVNHKA